MKKKLTALLLVLTVVLTLASCGKKKGDDQTTAATTTEETTAEVGETGETSAETEASTNADETTAAPVEQTTAGGGDNKPTEAPSNPGGTLSNQSSKQEIADLYNKATAATKKANTLRGKESVELSKVAINGNDSGTIAKAVRGIIAPVVKNSYKVSDSKPIPYHDQEVNVLPDDIKSFSIKDNGSTYTLKIQPKDDINPKKNLEGSTGRFFPIVDNIKDIAAGVPGVKFEGGVEQGITADYKDASIEVTIDKSTYQITGGTYKMNIYLNIHKASAKLIKVDEATAIISYTLTL